MSSPRVSNGVSHPKSIACTILVKVARCAKTESVNVTSWQDLLNESGIPLPVSVCFVRFVVSRRLLFYPTVSDRSGPLCNDDEQRKEAATHRRNQTQQRCPRTIGELRRLSRMCEG